MNSVVLHILSCHVPFVGGILVLALLLHAWRRQEPVLLRAAGYGVIAVALGTTIAWASGPASLSALETWIDSAGSAHADRHAGIGDFVMATWGLAAFAALWGIILARASRPAPRWHAPLLTVLVVLGLGLAAWAGHEGGRIRHAELRDATSVETAAESGGGADR